MTESLDVEALEGAIALATRTGKASREQIQDLLSGERARVRAVVEVLPAPELDWALGTEIGEQALRNAFALMPAYYRPGGFDTPVTVRYEVTRSAGNPVEQDVVFGPDFCHVREVDPAVEPDLRISLDAIGFTRIATALVRGLELMMRGELRVQGNVQVAMKMETFFGLADPGATR
ncbi:SCP2 sterol-binding domain-containing protein [Nocardia sp. BMG51109]|uniref:SCP2 sterol-binding domain-containing protein n=1 Tax=Nocardia sp. BMG51109 TaxID=1056816 RepID=UPI000466DDE4|nr:SCP2 sterol-binding domain-containing protein [Nocardia sp. BMG51109]